ncbi:hypothetical protein F0562_002532 [Nyssa sinensis]|uniref:Transcription repressor n=1 Tax=Nyssa sinensis TaxID=561372 RepID=A0A5J5C695_9ASTE|nr:hypothetical protein F0562_002532 [Nyssa sinensis]
MKLRDDLERLKKIRNHRGLRHYWGLRVRGQHTKTTGRRGKTERKMPSTLGRNLHLCFTKIKRTASAESSPTPLSTEDHSRPLPNFTNPTTSILIKNFNSIYDQTFDSISQSKSLSLSSSDDPSSSESDSEATIPDFATVFASQRFFFSSPGRSNSIIESSSSSPSQRKQPKSDTVLGGGIAIPTFSPDPYKDFRLSMQEMVEARDLIDVRANWDYLHELLLCYLALNPKSTHKFIVGAFADLLVSLMTLQAQGGGRETDFSVGGRNI